MIAPLAQLAEQLTLNQEVPGSIPGRRTIPHAFEAIPFAVVFDALVGVRGDLVMESA